MTKCSGCDARGARFRCSRCKTARYCSSVCQKRSWAMSHKFDCNPHAAYINAQNEEEDKRWDMWVTGHEIGTNSTTEKSLIATYSAEINQPLPQPSTKSERPSPPPAMIVEHWDDDAEIKPGLGARYPIFVWRQTTTELHIKVRLPCGVSSRGLHVKLAPHYLSIISSCGTRVLQHSFADQIYVGGNCDQKSSLWNVCYRFPLCGLD